MAEARATKAGLYTEVLANVIAVTKAGLYVEVESASVRVTKAGVYVEVGQSQLRVTKAGIYVEIEEDIPMPQRFYPGEGYTQVILGGVDITGFLNMTEVAGTVDELDATTLADEDPQFEPGAIRWDIPLEGLLDGQMDKLLGYNALRNGRTYATYFLDLTVIYGELNRGTVYHWNATEWTGGYVSEYHVGPTTAFQDVTFRATISTSGQPARSAYV